MRTTALGLVLAALPFLPFVPFGSNWIWSAWIAMAAMTLVFVNGIPKMSMAPVLFIVAMAVSSIVSDDPGIGLRKTVICAVAFVFVTAFLKSIGTDQRRRAFKLMIAGIVIHAVLVLIGFVVVDLLGQTWIPGYLYNDVGTFLYGNSADMSRAQRVLEYHEFGGRLVPANFLRGTEGFFRLDKPMYRPTGLCLTHGDSVLLLAFALNWILNVGGTGFSTSARVRIAALLMLALAVSLSRTGYTFVFVVLLSTVFGSLKTSRVHNKWLMRLISLIVLGGTSYILYEYALSPVLAALNVTESKLAVITSEGETRETFLENSWEHYTAGNTLVGSGPTMSPWAHVGFVQILVDTGALGLAGLFLTVAPLGVLLLPGGMGRKNLFERRTWLLLLLADLMFLTSVWNYREAVLFWMIYYLAQWAEPDVPRARNVQISPGPRRTVRASASTAPHPALNGHGGHFIMDALNT